MQVYLINSDEDFKNYYRKLFEDSKIGLQQAIHVIGFDIEYICKENLPESFLVFNKLNMDDYNTGVCLIQISSKNVCLVINLIQMGLQLPNKLIKLITKDNWIKAGVGVELDLFHLSKNYNLGHCAGGFDIKNFALIAEHPNPNLENLCNQFYDPKFKKMGGIYDWTKPFTKDQINYAAKDSIISYNIFRKIFEPSIKFIKQCLDDNNINQLNIVNYDSNVEKKELKFEANFIGRLNELAQRDKLEIPIYKEIMESGNLFQIKCIFMNKETTGSGKNKKEAKYQSAKNMYNLIKN